MKSIIIIIFSLFIASCSDQQSVLDGENNHTSSFSNYDLGTYTKDVLNKYDKPNLQGIIIMNYRYYNFYNDGRHVNSTLDYFYGVLLNNDRTDFLELESGIFVNNRVLVNEDGYTYYLDYNSDNTFIQYFGNGNNIISIDSNEYFDHLDVSVNFNQPVSLNMSTNDTITRTTPLDISWSNGGSGELTQIEMLMKYDDSPIGSQIGFYEKSFSDSITIDTTRLKRALEVDGNYILTVINFQPHYIPLSNGNELLILGMSEDIISLYVRD
jgi:hypothetical protein